MSMSRATRGHALLVLIGVLMVATPDRVVAAQQTLLDGGGLVRTSNGSFQLSADAGPPPRTLAGFERFGIWDAARTEASGRFQSVLVRYHAQAPVGTEVFVAVRASVDGTHWSEWEWDVADGALITFAGAQRWFQHRVVMVGSAGRTPVVSEVQLMPQPVTGNTLVAATNPKRAVAPTYRLRITRQGMVGRRTANGHIIKRRDFFASLPSWKSLSSKNGSEYMVRLSANGRSVVVRVADVGPWNTRDNFWDARRQRYKDLPVGWPEDHAAYFENYNRRRAERGWVRFPTAVDVGDGAYWALGLKGAQATADVTFLWLGADPGPNPKPRNSHPSKRPRVSAP